MDEEEEDDYYDEEEEEEEMDLGPTVEELIERARAEQQRLQDVNEGMQKKVGKPVLLVICVQLRNVGNTLTS